MDDEFIWEDINEILILCDSHKIDFDKNLDEIKEQINADIEDPPELLLNHIDNLIFAFRDED